MNTFQKYFLVLLVLSGTIACTQTSSRIPPAFLPIGQVESSNGITVDEYLLQCGDILDVKFYYNPELNERVTIRPDGKISLQLIDEISAVGLTPSELNKILIGEYSKVLKEPEVAVIVQEFAGQSVYVGGEVFSPGLIPISGKLTALQAVFHAGGFKHTASLSSVVVLRDQGTEKPMFAIINLKKDLFTRTQHNDILLKPYDVIFVPKTGIAKLNQFMDQYFWKLLPIQATVGFSYLMWFEK